ncbi:hypothetical protein V7122_19410 [Bacillus sp. JJ1532]|uniref:hypothetical protein n=1 Tax=Bacillus sp. JJ1532 TaxID=3122958 RepID=UPI002FFE310A
MSNDIKKEFKKVTDLISKVLSEKTYTRNSDTALYLECCRELGATDIATMMDLNLNVISVHKTRQKLNREGLFLPSDEVQNVRKQRQKVIREIMVS